MFYLNDELGSYISKDLLGNAKLVPVIRFPASVKPGMGTSFSVLFLVKDVKKGEALVQSIADSPGEVDSAQKILSNNIVFGEHAINKKVDYMAQISSAFTNFLLQMETHQRKRRAEATGEKIRSLRAEQAGTAGLTEAPVRKFDAARGKPVQVFSNYPCLKQSQLEPELFTLTESPAEAEFLFSNRHPALLASSPEHLKALLSKPRNSFDSEFHFVRKDFLNKHVQAYWGARPWWPVSFDMSTQLPEFAGEFLFRKFYSKENNLWLIKPSNLAHSANMVVTDSLDLVLKNAEHIRGINENAIASKYIERCMRFRKCKFDMRWVVVVSSFEPLEVYVYRHFWVRVSKNEFTTDKRRWAREGLTAGCSSTTRTSLSTRTSRRVAADWTSTTAPFWRSSRSRGPRSRTRSSSGKCRTSWPSSSLGSRATRKSSGKRASAAECTGSTSWWTRGGS